MRGEDKVTGLTSTVGSGSPPHARGRLIYEADYILDCRITPACAGKTREGLNQKIINQDHPRMRGEDLREVEKSRFAKGSPPHARGRLGLR